MATKIDFPPGGQPSAAVSLLAAHRVRQAATRTAQLAQAGGADAAHGTRLAPGDGTFNKAAAAILTQWKDE